MEQPPRLLPRPPELAGRVAVLAATCAALELAPACVNRILGSVRSPSLGQHLSVRPSHRQHFQQPSPPSGQPGRLAATAALPCAATAATLAAAARRRQRGRCEAGLASAARPRVARAALLDSLAATEAGRLSASLDNLARVPRELGAKLAQPLREISDLPGKLSSVLAEGAEAAQGVASAAMELPGNVATSTAQMANFTVQAARNIAEIPGHMRTRIEDIAKGVEGIVNGVQQTGAMAGEAFMTAASLPSRASTAVQSMASTAQERMEAVGAATEAAVDLSTKVMNLPGRLSTSFVNTVETVQRTASVLVEFPGNAATSTRQLAESTVRTARNVAAIPGHVRTRVEEIMRGVQHTGSVVTAAASFPSRAFAVVESIVGNAQETAEAAAAAAGVVGAVQAVKRAASAQRTTQLWEREAVNRERLKKTAMELKELQKQMAELYPDEKKEDAAAPRTPAAKRAPAVVQRPITWRSSATSPRRGKWEMKGNTWRRG